MTNELWPAENISFILLFEKDKENARHQMRRICYVKAIEKENCCE